VGIRFTKKSELTDFIENAGIFVRHRVVERFTEARISGWRAGDVRVEAVPSLRDQDLNYRELVIIGHTRGYAERVGLDKEDVCQECNRRPVYSRPQEGLVIPEECWDGSDIFVIDELPGLEIVTEAVRQLIEEQKYTGVICTPISEWRDPLQVGFGDFDIAEAIRRSRGQKQSPE